MIESKPCFLLVHGSWHGAWSWDPVRDRLHKAGYRTVAPTLPGHAPDDDRSGITHDSYVQAVLAALDSDQAHAMVLVGHSFAGSIISRVADLRPERCHSLVYYAAFVPADGGLVDLPEDFVQLLSQLAAASPDNSALLPYRIFRNGMANTADEATAQAIYQRLVPEPIGPAREPIRLPRLSAELIPAAYIHCGQDRSMPPGHLHPGQSSRLKNSQVIEIDADHEALLTAPGRLAAAIIEAARLSPAPM